MKKFDGTGDSRTKSMLMKYKISIRSDMTTNHWIGLCFFWLHRASFFWLNYFWGCVEFLNGFPGGFNNCILRSCCCAFLWFGQSWRRFSFLLNRFRLLLSRARLFLRCFLFQTCFPLIFLTVKNLHVNFRWHDVGLRDFVRDLSLKNFAS